MGRDASTGFHSSGFCNDQAGTTGCPRAKMNQLPIIGKSILITILTHGRDPNAIADGDASNSQRIK